MPAACAICLSVPWRHRPTGWAALAGRTREMLMTLTADDLRAAEGGQLAEDDLRDAEREVEEEAVQNGVNNCEK